MMMESPGADRRTEELRCPTCGAKQGRTDVCRRCKSDLRFLREALDAYDRHRRSGLRDLHAGDLEAALWHARRCHQLQPGPASHRLLAVCQLLRGDWFEAMELAQDIAEDDAGSRRN